MKIDLTGYRALVTGGTRGIGLAIVQSLLECGAEVTALAANETRLSELETNKKPLHRLHTFRLDLDKEHEVAAACVELRNRNIDILVNNAGVNALAAVGEMDLDEFDTIMRINLRAPVALCNALVPKMAERGFGRIINLTSIFSDVSKVRRANYSTSKFGLRGFTRTLALDHAKHNVLANCVAPGFIETELTEKMLGAAGIEEIIKAVPIGRLGHPSEVAALVAFLASPLNTFITGQNILIDGGFTSA